MKPIAVDLFCGGGGAALGLMQAGFEVVGIDIQKHNNYPGHFIQGDALNPPVNLSKAAFVWASPPCQRYSPGSRACLNPDKYKDYPDLIEPVRALLSGYPFTCIENVPTAPLKVQLALNGPSVGLEWIQRKRHFELSFWVWQIELPKPKGIRFSILKSRSATNPVDAQLRKDWGLPATIPKDVAKVFMGIPPDFLMTDAEIGESVSPPMAKYIGEQAICQMKGSTENENHTVHETE